jgi:hypothetical protein
LIANGIACEFCGLGIVKCLTNPCPTRLRDEPRVVQVARPSLQCNEWRQLAKGDRELTILLDKLDKSWAECWEHVRFRSERPR